MAKPKCTSERIAKKKKQKCNQRQKWDVEKMKLAVSKVLEGECGYMKAAKEFNLPRSTLERYVSAARKNNNTTMNAQLGRKPILDKEVEEEKKQFCLEMKAKFFGLTRCDVMRLAFQVAEQRKMKHNFNRDDGKAGWKWLRGFLLRHAELAVRSQAISYARVRGFSQENIDQFFDIYEEAIKKIEDDPLRLFNVDETGISIVQHKTTKILGLKGKRQIGALSSAEWGSLITVVTCMSVTGQYCDGVSSIRETATTLKRYLKVHAPAG